MCIASSLSRSALHLAISVSVETSPRRAKSIWASRLRAFSDFRFSASYANDRVNKQYSLSLTRNVHNKALSALITSPVNVTTSFRSVHLDPRRCSKNRHAVTRKPLNASVWRLITLQWSLMISTVIIFERCWNQQPEQRPIMMANSC